jgi:hypothetical protein
MRCKCVFVPLPPFLEARYAAECEPTIDAGIEFLKKAVAFKPDYDDAMAYLSLLYRRKADAVATEFEREQLSKMGDEWIDKVKDIKQKRMEPEQR